MCNCKYVVRTDYNTDVCVCCGNESQCPLSIIQAERPVNMCMFPTGYSRHKRFSKILDSVLFPTPTSADNNMLKFLFKKSFSSITELIGAMKSATLRDKRYSSLHLFCKLFVRSYKAPAQRNYYEVKRCIMKKFECIEFGHLGTCPNKQFPNYNWLLTILLAETGLTGHVQYVKNLRCKHRKEFYTHQLDEIRRAYKHERDQDCASNFRIPTSERSDGRIEHLSQIRISTVHNGVPPRMYE